MFIYAKCTIAVWEMAYFTPLHSVNNVNNVNNVNVPTVELDASQRWRNLRYKRFFILLVDYPNLHVNMLIYTATIMSSCQPGVVTLGEIFS